MKKINNTIKLAVFLALTMGLTDAAIAEHHESTKLKAQFQDVEKSDVELYDYHSGVTYTGTLQRFVFHRDLEHVADKPEEKHSEATPIK